MDTKELEKEQDEKEVIPPTPDPREPVENGEKPEEGQEPEKNGKDFDPNPNHPRFKEVYGKMKQYEREKEELLKDVDAIKAFNREIAASLEQIKTTKLDKQPAQAPNPQEDPDGYRAYFEHQLAEDRKKNREQAELDLHRILVETMASAHDDYDDMVKIATREMDRDPELRKKIYGTQNVPRAAYEFGKKRYIDQKKQEKEEVDRLLNIRGARVEGSGENGPADGGDADDHLSEDEVRIVKRLFDDIPFADGKKKYLAQKKALKGGRR